jgi:hypothetical protein
MPAVGAFRFARFDCVLASVAADRLEYPVAVALPIDQRLLDQPREVVDDIVGLHVLADADGLGSFERECPGEGRQAPQHRPLRFGQQAEAPLDRRAQRLMARH